MNRLVGRACSPTAPLAAPARHVGLQARSTLRGLRAIGAPLLPLLLLLLLAGCSQATPQPLIFGAAPWPDGEQSVYTLTDASGQQVGSATYTLTSRLTGADGEDAWQLVRAITALDSRETMTVTMDAAGFRPQSSQLERVNSTGRETVDAVYSGGQVDLTLNTRQNIMTVQREQTPSDARETVALPMLLRSLPLANGYATQINTFLPVAAQLERITVRVAGEEAVTTPAGAFATWVVELDAGDAQSKAWIAREAPYLLIKYLDGRNKATLELNAMQ